MDLTFPRASATMEPAHLLTPRAGVTQLVECDLAKVDVAGSNPVSRSNSTCSESTCSDPHNGVPGSNTSAAYSKAARRLNLCFNRLLDTLPDGCGRALNEDMDIKREGVARKKRIKVAIIVILSLLALGAGGWRLSLLKPAAPTVEMATLWPDTVKRGPMVIDRKGNGTLVPEDI